MSKNLYRPTVSILGGDKRSIILSELLSNSGYDVLYADNNNLLKAALNRQVIVLPLPLTKDGVKLYCKNDILLNDIFDNLHPHSRLLCSGYSEELYSKIYKTGLKAYDYYNISRVQKANAYLTAEATVKILIENTPSALIENNILIIGNGRCSKALAELLSKIGCNVTVTSRKPKISLFSLINRIKLKNTAKLKDYIGNFDIIVNTAPSLVLDKHTLQRAKKSSVIVELASNCAGLDINAATALGINAVYAPSLPGKYSPESAAKVLYKSINKIIMEEFS